MPNVTPLHDPEIFFCLWLGIDSKRRFALKYGSRLTKIVATPINEPKFKRLNPLKAKIKWWAAQDLNLEPTNYEFAALTD